MGSNPPVMAFGNWVRDLTLRAEMFVLSRRPEPTQDPVRRFALTVDDYAYLAAIDAAFRDDEASR